MPVGFVLSAAVNAVTVDGVNTSVTVNASNVFSLPLGTMMHPQTKTIIVRGKMMNASTMTANYYNNSVSVTYTSNGTTATVGPIVVVQNPLGTPIIKIDKSQQT